MFSCTSLSGFPTAGPTYVKAERTTVVPREIQKIIQKRKKMQVAILFANSDWCQTMHGKRNSKILRLLFNVITKIDGNCS